MVIQIHADSGMVGMAMLAITMGLIITTICIGHFVFHVIKYYRNDSNSRKNSRKGTA